MSADPRVQQRRDQVHRASLDVSMLLSGLSPESVLWTRPPTSTLRVVERLIEHLYTLHGGTARVCPHALAPAFDRSPQPLVLDAVRGVLACVAEGCYARQSAEPDGPAEATCFLCGEATSGDRHDLFLAYGPILVAAALCPDCR